MAKEQRKTVIVVGYSSQIAQLVCYKLIDKGFTVFATTTKKSLLKSSDSPYLKV
jgi:hypothetical protein